MKTTTHASIRTAPGWHSRLLWTVALLLALVAGGVHVAPSAHATSMPVFEESDPRFQYSGGWPTWSNTALSGGSYAYANAPDAAVTVAIEGGTAFDFVTRTGPEFGIVSVSIDKAPPQDVDLYSPDNRYQQAFAFALSGPGRHTVRLEWTGRKNASASGTYIGIDAIRTDGTVVRAPIRFEEPLPCFTMAGAWSSWRNVALSGGSYAYANAPGSSARVAFLGTGISLSARTGPEFGIAGVYLDGMLMESVDLYSPVTTYDRVVFISSLLAPGPHTLEVRWTGNRNPASSNTYINVDAVDVFRGVPAPDTAMTRREEDAPTVTFAGVWKSWASAALSGGAYRYTNTSGSAASFSFEGTRLDWIMRTGPEFGIAAVSIDGATPFLVDLYSATNEYQQIVASTGTIAAGWHTVSVSWTGLRNAASRGTYIGVDAFDVKPAAAPEMAGGVLAEQQDPHVSLAGTWYTWTNAALSGGSYRYATGAGVEAGVSFTGTRLDVIARTGPEFGVAAFTIDDGPPILVDLYAPSSTVQTRVFTTWDLPTGSHTVRMRWTGLKNPASAGTYVGLDAVRVAGALTSSPVEEVDYRVWKSGSWSSWSSPLLSGGSYMYSNATGSAADIAFIGTGLSLVMRTGPEFGIAMVSVDGGAPKPVDLYSPETRYRQTVWSIASLASGRHTVRVAYSGTKNPASSGTYVCLDAVTTDGVLDQATTRFEETHPWVMYSGPWTTYAESGLSGGSHRFTNVVGSSVGAAFMGRRARFIVRTGPELGIAEVLIDGLSVGMFDLYSPSYAYQQISFDSDDLVPGSHVVSMRCTGDKNPSSSGVYIAVDAIDIAGSLEQPPNTFTISGQGWGHSIGLSQYGAKGFAEAGKSYQEILGWYYQATTIGSPSQQPGLVKVNLQKDKAFKSAWVVRAGDPARPMEAVDLVTGQRVRYEQVGGVYIVMPHPNYATGTIVYRALWTGASWVPDYSAPSDAHPLGGVMLASPNGTDLYTSSLIELETASGPFDRTNVRWRGAIAFSGSQFSGLKAVNYVSMSHYLYGVVPRESPASWHMEALKAQAVAARSYAYQKVIAGTELACTTADQVYGGHSRGTELYENSRTNQAVDETSAQYVMYGTSVVQAFFCSSSGGHTANIEDVWVNSTPKPYYKGVPDPYGVGSQWGPYVYSPDALAAKLGHGGSVVRVAPEYVASGHVKYITITYSDGTSARITGDTFRSKLGLNSTHFQIAQR